MFTLGRFHRYILSTEGVWSLKRESMSRKAETREESRAEPEGLKTPGQTFQKEDFGAAFQSIRNFSVSGEPEAVLKQHPDGF